MPIRGNKPVSRTAKILMALSLAAILAVVVIGIAGVVNRQPSPARGAASLPGQAAAAGAGPSTSPAAN